jgi:SAM-dependent methyltransferase
MEAMLTRELLVYVQSNLPSPPARVLEIGAGEGELALALASAGYEVTAIDPAAAPDSHVQQRSLLEVQGSFDAALSVVALHHVEPLEASCAHLATLLPAGGTLVIDEIDIERYDERVTGWWVGQRRARGHVEERSPAEILDTLRRHIHPLARINAALAPYFDFGAPVRGAYLHRWSLSSALLAAELELIADGLLPAVGARQVATRNADRAAHASG